MPILVGVAAFDAVVVACLLVLFIAATRQVWEGALRSILSQLPVVGSWAASNSDRVAGALMSWAVGWAASGLGAAADLVDNIQGNLHAFANQTWRAAYWTRDRLTWIVNTYVPAQVEVVRSELYTRYDWLLTGDAQTLQSAETYAQQQAATVRSELYTRYDWLLTGISQALAAAEAYADHAVARLRTQVGTAHDALEQRLGADISRQSAELVADLAGIRDLLAQRVADLLGRIESAAGAARTYADQVGAGSRSYTDAQTATTAAVAAAAVATVATAVKVIEDSPCMQRCATLGDLGAAIEAIDVAAILGLIAYAAADAPAATRALRETIVPVVDAVESTAREMIGLAS